MRLRRGIANPFMTNGAFFLSAVHYKHLKEGIMRKYIGYDLHDKDRQDYQDLYDFIESNYEAYRILESMYVIFTSDSNEKILNDLTRVIGKRNASIVVGDMPTPVNTNGIHNTKCWFGR